MIEIGNRNEREHYQRDSLLGFLPHTRILFELHDLVVVFMALCFVLKV